MNLNKIILFILCIGLINNFYSMELEVGMKIRQHSLLEKQQKKTCADDVFNYIVDYKSFLVLTIEAYQQILTDFDKKKPYTELLTKIDQKLINIDENKPVCLTEKDLYDRLFPCIICAGQSFYPQQSKSAKDAGLEVILIKGQAVYLGKSSENPNTKPSYALLQVPGVNILNTFTIEEYKQQVFDIIDDLLEKKKEN